MKIYVSRHGQTEWNRLDKICGVTDIELTEKGIFQARQLALAAVEKGDIDIIISSPLKRAVATSKIVAEEIGAEVINDNRLIEWDYGNYEGIPRSANGFARSKIDFGCKMGQNGESLLHLSHRVYSLLDDVIANYHNKNVLLVCHGGVCRVIETYFRNMTTDEFLNFFTGNCELREFIVET